MTESDFDPFSITLPLDKWTGRDFRRLASWTGAAGTRPGNMAFWDLDKLFHMEEEYAEAYWYVRRDGSWQIPGIDGTKVGSAEALADFRQQLMALYVKAQVAPGPVAAGRLVDSLEAEVAKALGPFR